MKFLILLNKVSRAMAELVYRELFYKKMLKSLIRVIFVVSSLVLLLQLKVRGESLEADQMCDPIRSRLVISIIEKITRLANVSAVEFNCKSISKINLIEEDSILLTTTRKRGKEYICLHASGNSRPCQIKVGVVENQENPNDILCKLTQQDCSNVADSPLTETVERLYLRPSSLIR